MASESDVLCRAMQNGAAAGVRGGAVGLRGILPPPPPGATVSHGQEPAGSAAGIRGGAVGIHGWSPPPPGAVSHSNSAAGDHGNVGGHAPGGMHYGGHDGARGCANAIGDLFDLGSDDGMDGTYGVLTGCIGQAGVEEAQLSLPISLGDLFGNGSLTSYSALTVSVCTKASAAVDGGKIAVGILVPIMVVLLAASSQSAAVRRWLRHRCPYYWDSFIAAPPRHDASFEEHPAEAANAFDVRPVVEDNAGPAIEMANIGEAKPTRAVSFH